MSNRDDERKRAHDETGRCAYASILEMVEALRKAEEEDHSGKAHDDAIETITQDPLSVLVRDGWREPGRPTEDGPDEYEILLSTGGPATRIIGKLDQHCQPETARLEVQDWFVPWQEWRGEGYSESTLLEYARCFYFGD